MKIISPRQYHTVKEFNLEFEVIGSNGSEFAFPCDERGNVTNLNPCAAKNLAMCLANPDKYEAFGVCVRESDYTQPAVGECELCGRHVDLDGFTNTCECGADYNMSGHLLASREQWGEETGESVADILSVDMNRFGSES